MPSIQDVQNWRGQDLHGSDGKIGEIADVYLDRQTEQPEWLAVKTGLFGSKLSFVPIQQASASGDGVTVPYSKDKVKDAPNVEADGELSPDEERRLYQHYGVDFGDYDYDAAPAPAPVAPGDPTPQGTAGVVGNDVSGPETDDAMTRSEEELTVGKTQRETGRVRLKKYIVEDQVTETVPVRREEVRVEREPITDANVDEATEGPALHDEEHEVVLQAEEPVIEKRVVPKERVRLDKETHVDEEQVAGELRKEHIEVDAPRR